jgi:hypothetical protein
MQRAIRTLVRDLWISAHRVFNPLDCAVAAKDLGHWFKTIVLRAAMDVSFDVAE